MLLPTRAGLPWTGPLPAHPTAKCYRPQDAARLPAGGLSVPVEFSLQAYTSCVQPPLRPLSPSLTKHMYL